MRDRGHRRVLGDHPVVAAGRGVLGALPGRRRLPRAAGVGPGAPEVVYAPPWGDHPRFIDAMAARARAALEAVAPAARAGHPARVHRPQRPRRHGRRARRTPASSRPRPARWPGASATRAGPSPTRAGAALPRDPWLEPDVADVLRDLARAGARDVVVVPLGFVSRPRGGAVRPRRRGAGGRGRARSRIPPSRRRQRSPGLHRHARRPGQAGRMTDSSGRPGRAGGTVAGGRGGRGSRERRA